MPAYQAYNIHNFCQLRAAHPKCIFLIQALLCFCISPGFAQGDRKDSVVAPASTKYVNSSILRTIFVGKNYRDEWVTPVKVPVFNLNTEQGGFTIEEAGGGRQTSNLRLKDKQGKEWVLRSVDKSVKKSMTPQLRNTMIEMLMQDLISASHPYAALIVPGLAEAAGVIVPKPNVFFVPDDSAFGEHRELFANTICFLEEREPTPDGSDTKSTVTIMGKVFEEADHRLLQQEVLRARLLDMLIGDWDRHGDQWRWGVKDSAGATFYYPIPRDRDFALFRSDGLFVKAVSLTSLPYMWGFTKKAMSLKRLNAKISYIDAQWLNELNAEDWKTAVSLLQNNLTDDVIDNAVKRLPAEVYALSGRNLSVKLKTRRDGLLKHAMRYYKHLAVNPFIIGTEERDLFTIKSEGRHVSVSVSRNAPDKKNSIIYQRKFNPRHTKTICIMGLGADDEFQIEESVSSSIKLQLQGGAGDDEYHVKGKIKTRVEDTVASGKRALAQK